MSTQFADQPLSTLTLSELRALIRETVEEVLKELFSDPDARLATLHPKTEETIQDSLTYAQSEGEWSALKETLASLERVGEGAEMSTITMELPDTLARQIETQGVPLEELQAVVRASVELWLAEREQRQSGSSENGSRFQESAIPFARRLIAQNRELFDELARR